MSKRPSYNIEIDQDVQSILSHTQFLDYLPRLVMLIDLEGRIIYWNKAGNEIFGYDDREIIGRSVWSLFPGRNRQDFWDEVDILKKNGKVSYDVQARRNDGKLVWLDVKKVIVNVNEKSRNVILISASDISEQKNAEQELAKEQVRLKSILENTVEGIITIDKNGNILTFNKAAEEIFKYNSEEVIGKNVSKLMPKAYAVKHDKYIKNYLKTGEAKIIGIGREVRGKRKDGTVFPMELAVSEMNIDGEIIFSGIIRDIMNKRDLENEIIKVSEEERFRIGQDLHDGLGQMLTGIGLISQNLARKLKSNGLAGADEVQEIAAMIKEADKLAKGLARGMVNIDLDHDGMRMALENLCKRSENLFKIQCTFENEGDISTKNKTISLHLYRIVQEAISNAVKHGNADKVWVRCKCLEQFIQIIIDDNGTGFADRSGHYKTKGMGLKTMHYRANIMGGYLEITESNDGYTRIICRIPNLKLNSTLEND